MVVQKGGEVTQLCANIDKLPLLKRRKYAGQMLDSSIQGYYSRLL